MYAGRIIGILQISVDSNTPREEMLSAVQRHFSLDLVSMTQTYHRSALALLLRMSLTCLYTLMQQNLNEAEVIVKFVQATRTLASG